MSVRLLVSTVQVVLRTDSLVDCTEQLVPFGKTGLKNLYQTLPTVTILTVTRTEISVFEGNFHFFLVVHSESPGFFLQCCHEQCVKQNDRLEIA